MMDRYRSITFVFNGFRCVYVKPVQIVRYIGNKSSNMVATFLDQQCEHWIFRKYINSLWRCTCKRSGWPSFKMQSKLWAEKCEILQAMALLLILKWNALFRRSKRVWRFVDAIFGHVYGLTVNRKKLYQYQLSDCAYIICVKIQFKIVHKISK